MPATYIHFSDDLKKKKEATRKSWEEILVAGVESAFSIVRESCREALSDTQEHLSGVEDMPDRVGDKNDPEAVK